ncbi:hypothetical protein ACH5RR_025679 [Cinchona calisaya]|uniref:RanBP2-type domain-containing protein n=1 Tax=Cinchona calisaya TaxID=153742 RepID=A0ABD2Z3I7_9GENT
MDTGRGYRSGGMLALLALQAVSEYCRLERKPPVTAGLVAANTLIYLRVPAFLDNILPTLDQVLFNADLIVRHKDLKRFVLSAFYHIGEHHLVYNMFSLLWKGIRLENSMGSTEFASLVAALVVMSQGITLLLSKCLLVFFDYERAYYNEYAAGFSGVLFGMKVILNSQSDSDAYVHGVPVPARFAAWAELILIQMLVPGVSFIGHLGGILAGLLYLHLKASYSGPDPLTKIFRGLTSILGWPLRFVQHLYRPRRRRISGRGTVGGTQRRTAYVWRCSECTYDNSGRLDVCEMCGSSRDDDGLPSPDLSGQTPELSLEELRSRRVQRFIR